MPPLPSERTDTVGTDRPQLLVVRDLQGTTALDPYLSLRAAAAYLGVSPRWLRDRLKDSVHPLPCYRLPGGKILIRRSDADTWMARYRRVGDPDVDTIVSDVLTGLR